MTDQSPDGRDENQAETAAYIFDMLIGLSSVARDTKMPMLAYLLEMAGSEASRIAEEATETTPAKRTSK